MDRAEETLVSARDQKRAIEESFPIAEINKLAVPERNSFKPIYQMHKWFARRASSVFRAVLLGALKPSGTAILEEFYKDHTNDPDSHGLRILDPFMGGGTTVVEALRLGCRVTGIDLSPVAWFIVKTESEAVAIENLEAAFASLEQRITSSGRPLKDELLSHYKTDCPCCGGVAKADVIYQFWVKSAICTDPTCRKPVPLFSSFIVAVKTPTVRYVPDHRCEKCGKEYDLEVELFSLVPEGKLCVSGSHDSAGDKRMNRRWAVHDSATQTVLCPWCYASEKVGDLKTEKKLRKRINLTVILCPHCGTIWQHRGTLPDSVDCPACSKASLPQKGSLSDKGSFTCTCGNKDKIIKSIRLLPKEQLLPIHAYAIEGYCPECGGDIEIEESDPLGFSKSNRSLVTHACKLHANKGKFFKSVSTEDLRRYQNVEKRWQTEKDTLPYPKGEIPEGEETHRLLQHHYRYWHQMFTPRQLLSLCTLLKAIGEEKNDVMRDMLLSSFQMCLEANNTFARYRTESGGRSPFGGIFARHDYQPKLTPCEINVLGPYKYYGTFSACFGKLLEGKRFNLSPFDRTIDIGSGSKSVQSDEQISATADNCTLLCADSQELAKGEYDLVITDPPYAGNVNYSELADFFYVWLRLVLAKYYPAFSPELTPKVQEIIENPTRGKSPEEYQHGLTEVWKKCRESLIDDGLMAFTFHHAEERAWEALLQSLCDAGFLVVAIYPIHGESESSLHLQDKEAIAYDLIHICRRRNAAGVEKQKSWAGIRQEIRQKARQEIKLIEEGRYGKEKLAAADLNIILIGKCLEQYSRHYGLIVDYRNDVVPLRDALVSIRIMVEQLVSSAQPLPSELEHLDAVSYVYLTCLCDRKEIQSDEVHKVTRAIIEPEALMKAGVITKWRAQRGRTYYVKSPEERFKDLERFFLGVRKTASQLILFPEIEEEQFDRVSLVDVIHFLMGLAEKGENLMPWLNEFRQISAQIRVSLEYLRAKNPTFGKPIGQILGIFEV